jgi:hypothetical protein
MLYLSDHKVVLVLVEWNANECPLTEFEYELELEYLTIYVFSANPPSTT